MATFWRYRYRRKLILITLIILFLIVLLVISFRLDLSDNSFLDLSKCPACYGASLCPALITKNSNPITLDTFITFRNAKNVYYGRLGGKVVILKKLASNWELDKLDKFLCNINKWLKDSRVTDPVYECSLGDDTNIFHIQNLQDVPYTKQIDIFERTLQLGKSFFANYSIVSDALHCHSRRFLTSILNKSIFARTNSTALLSNLIFLLINPEPIFLQVFNPISSNFPQLLGSCGRVIVQEYVGPTLTYFKSFPLYIRLKIAKKLLNLAHELTFDRPMGFNFYLTDVSFDNFAVALNGSDVRVVLIDAEGILVTDPQSLDGIPSNPHIATYANPFGGQNGRLQFSSSDLCHYSQADHNFYAICECLLSEMPCSPEIPGGILWGIPREIEDLWHIKMLVKSCQTGSQDRIKIARELTNNIDNALIWIAAN